MTEARDPDRRLNTAGGVGRRKPLSRKYSPCERQVCFLRNMRPALVSAFFLCFWRGRYTSERVEPGLMKTTASIRIVPTDGVAVAGRGSPAKGKVLSADWTRRCVRAGLVAWRVGCRDPSVRGSWPQARQFLTAPDVRVCCRCATVCLAGCSTMLFVLALGPALRKSGEGRD